MSLLLSHQLRRVRLQTLLMRKDILSYEETRFYMAETVSAIEVLHKNNYIHRYADSASCPPASICCDRKTHVYLGSTLRQ